jgi:hypothetical protein
MKIFAVIIVSIFIFWACTNAPSGKVVYKTATPTRTSKDFFVPKKMRTHIENEYLKFIRSKNPKNVLTDEELLLQIPRDFLDVKIRFRGANPGTLSDHVEFILPRGGGEIDLKNYVVGNKGSFYLTYEAARSDEPDKAVDSHLVYFLSESKKQAISGDTFGAGCGQYMDVTHVLSQARSKGGFQLNATESRYVPVITGVLYFVHFDENRKIYIAAVRILDSRFLDQMCDIEK